MRTNFSLINTDSSFGPRVQLELTDALLYAVLIVIITPPNHCPYFCKD